MALSPGFIASYLSITCDEFTGVVALADDDRAPEHCIILQRSRNRSSADILSSLHITIGPAGASAYDIVASIQLRPGVLQVAITPSGATLLGVRSPYVVGFNECSVHTEVLISGLRMLAEADVPFAVHYRRDGDFEGGPDGASN